MKKDIIFVCHKCEHNLYLSGAADLTGKQILKKLQNLDCPDCGEEPSDWTGLWSILRLGNFDKEQGEL